MQHAVLHVDETGERQVRERLAAVRDVLHQPEEDAIRRQHLAALDERQPVVETLADRAVGAQRLLIGPVDLGRRRLLVHGDLVEARVVPGRLAEELVPGVEPGRHVPDGLRERQPGQFWPHHRHQRQADALAQEAVVVVDELDDAVVEPLVVRHVGERRVDADGLAEDLDGRPMLLEEPIEDVARPLLIARHDALFETGVFGAGDRLARHRGCRGHSALLRGDMAREYRPRVARRGRAGGAGKIDAVARPRASSSETRCRGPTICSTVRVGPVEPRRRADKQLTEDGMKNLLFATLALALALGPAIAAAQGTTSGSGGTSGSSGTSTSPGSSGTTGSGSSSGSSSAPSTTSPSASPSTSGDTSTDFSQFKSKADCEKAGGDWQMSTSVCQKRSK